MKPLRQAKQDTRVRQRQIAEAAMTLIAEKGVRRLSIAAVARRVGLVPSGIYRHYKNKDQVLSAVLDLLQGRLTALVDGAVAESDHPLEQLQCVLMSHVRFFREGRALPRVMFSEDTHLDSPQRRRRILEIQTAYLERIGELVCRGQRQGCIRPELDPQTVALLFVGTIVPAAVRMYLSEGRFDITRHARQVWPMFLAAVTPPAPPEK